jgi:hypothetical protein
MTDPLADAVSHYLQSLSDDSFHSLRELGEDAVPELSKRFASTADPELRAFIINVLWNIPCACHDLYKDALRDSHKVVWNEAINALVSPLSQASLQILKEEQQRLSACEPKSQKLEYINEAIEMFGGHAPLEQ